MKKLNSIYILLLCFSYSLVNLFSQEQDSIKKINLNEVLFKTYRSQIEELSTLHKVESGMINAGKKNEIIQLKNSLTNVADKSARQIFAKVPGIFVYDMDGSGNQLNISTRGLDPHRSWEFNMRQNNIMTNSDIYGYPASHYSPPLESIQKIELIRGTSALQYGSQFGGMINLLTKSADSTKTFNAELQNSVGSFGLFSSYNAVHGQVNKIKYYAYWYKRVSDGYRENSNSNAQAQFIQLIYEPNAKWTASLELARSQYVYRIPGALTDSMFYENPRQSTRARNYFSPDIVIPSFKLKWKANSNIGIDWTNSAVLGTRNSVQFIGFANQPDTFNIISKSYNARQVDIDQFNSYTSELKAQFSHSVFGLKNTLITGFRAIHNELNRRQLGKGTGGTDYDLHITGDFGRDLKFTTKNLALFAENLIEIHPRLDLVFGFRIEEGNSRMSGKISYLEKEKIPITIHHRFPLFGSSLQVKLSKSVLFYSAFSQGYRPTIFADLIPASVLEQNDPNIKDGKGYNLELGFKGNVFSKIKFDINYFQLLYKNKIGSVLQTDSLGNQTFYKTNIADAITHGVESLIEIKLLESNRFALSIFSAGSYMNAHYKSGELRNGNENVDITNKKVETVPAWISRNGVQGFYKKLSCSLQYSYVSKTYSDALNTINPSSNGARGLVPQYSIWDFNSGYRFHSKLMIKASVNNILNNSYFTKRPAGYPGQGVWSSDGRSFVGTLIVLL